MLPSTRAVERGFTAFLHTPKAGTFLAVKSLAWFLANLRPPRDARPNQYVRPENDYRLRGMVDGDYRQLSFDIPPG